MEVTKLITTRDYAFSGGVYFKGNVFYVSETYRKPVSTVDISDIYDSEGAFIGNMTGHWFDFANKTLFVKADKEPRCKDTADMFEEGKR